MTVKNYLWTPSLSAPLPLWHSWPPAPPLHTTAWPLHQWQPIDLWPNPSLPSPLLAAKGRGATADALNLHIMAVCVPQVNNSNMLCQWSLELSRGNLERYTFAIGCPVFVFVLNNIHQWQFKLISNETLRICDLRCLDFCLRLRRRFWNAALMLLFISSSGTLNNSSALIFFNGLGRCQPSFFWQTEGSLATLSEPRVQVGQVWCFACNEQRARCKVSSDPITLQFKSARCGIFIPQLPLFFASAGLNLCKSSAEKGERLPKKHQYANFVCRLLLTFGAGTAFSCSSIKHSQYCYSVDNQSLSFALQKSSRWPQSRVEGLTGVLYNCQAHKSSLLQPGTLGSVWNTFLPNGCCFLSFPVNAQSLRRSVCYAHDLFCFHHMFLHDSSPARYPLFHCGLCNILDSHSRGSPSGLRMYFWHRLKTKGKWLLESLDFISVAKHRDP